MPQKKICIAIDGNEANIANRVGSNTYAYEVISALEVLSQKEEVEVTVLLAAPPIKDLPKARKGWRYKVVGPRFLWTQIAAPINLFLNRSAYDVFFTPGHYAPRLCPVPYVSSVMDLAYLHFPEQFKPKDALQLKDWTEYSVASAKKVVTISEFSKTDILENYDKAETEVVVAYPAASTQKVALTQTEISSITQKLGISGPYILYVGTLQPRKNLLRVIEAFERVHRVLSKSTSGPKLRSKYSLKSLKENAGVQLVLAGKLGWLTEALLKRIDESPNKKDIILTGYVDEETKMALYQGSAGAILVGLYEGFGIPPLEAMAQGTVPVVSNTTSLPEVVGKAGILVNPESVASIANGLLNVLLLTAQERAKLRQLGRKQLQQFSWAKSAATILKVLKEVARPE